MLCALFLYEKYKDKYIAYSLGKFCFGDNSNPEDKDTMIFQQTSTFKKGVVQKNDDIHMIPCPLPADIMTIVRLRWKATPNRESLIRSKNTTKTYRWRYKNS